MWPPVNRCTHVDVSWLRQEPPVPFRMLLAKLNAVSNLFYHRDSFSGAYLTTLNPVS